MNSRRNYTKAAREEPVESWQVHGHRLKAPLISFTEEDEAGTHYPHCSALVVRVVVVRNRLGRMLVDDRSAVNILFDSAFNQMDVDHELTAISEPLFDFTGDSLIPRGRITLAVDFGEPPRYLRKFMEFLIVDTRFCLPRSPWKARVERFAGGHIHTSPGDEVSNAMRGCQDLDRKELDEEMILDEGLDPRIIGSNLLASLAEELEAFLVNPSEPTQELKVGEKLEEAQRYGGD
ncbi:Ribonuclease H [Abeliophyllum distichum]|uniref:Ribonuclease H n=1 Tax=Abeliophyllum distichum TaxID=126358 RepID=A0ABD1SBX3_9LAMI